MPARSAQSGSSRLGASDALESDSAKPPTESQPLPQGLNWDLWCGPTNAAGISSSVRAGVSWRDFWQFGCGAMGDFGCHDLDSCCLGLGIWGCRSRIEMRPAGNSDPGMAPFGEIGYFDFAERDNGPAGANHVVQRRFDAADAQ